MALTHTDLANRALSIIGTRLITAVETDQSKEAVLCRANLTASRRSILRMHPWKFACRRTILDEPNPEATAPLFGWANRHLLPANCVRLIRIEDCPDYEFEGRYLLTNTDPLYIKYIEEVAAYEDWDPACYEGTAHYLAWIICYALTQSQSLKDQIWQDMDRIVKAGRFVDSTESPNQTFDMDVWIRSRDVSANFIRDPMT